MSVNQQALETYWHFINERHQVYLNKSLGLPKPWTDDPILQEWKFCNVFRQLDKTSDWFIRNIIEQYDEAPPALMMFNIFVFRAFNWIPTYQFLGGWQTNWHPFREITRLEKYCDESNKLISSAYMIRGMRGLRKCQSIPTTLARIWNQKFELMDEIQAANTLQGALEAILARNFYGWGPFTAYQVVLDLMYTPILENATDINLWCSFGPGAKKGLKILFPDMAPMNEINMILHCHYLLNQQAWHLKDHMPIMNLQDIEYALCEMAKYWRVKQGEKMKERYHGR